MLAAASLAAGLLVLPLALPAASRAIPPPPTALQLEVERDGDRFRVTARADMTADARVAWDTLTDYARLPEFVPGITSTRVLSRTPAEGGERLSIEYVGSFRLLFLSVPTYVWLDVRHQPFTDVLARSMPAPRPDAPAATLKSFDGRYSLAVIGRGAGGTSRVRFDYRAQFELAEPLPPVIGPLLGTWAVRSVLREQFAAMVGEIERRSRARQGIFKGG